MNELATYTFLPWLRQGIANRLKEPSSGSRAVLSVDLLVSGDKVEGSDQLTNTLSREVQIYGPGDIIGLDNTSIIRVEPRNWITNFEPNYLPYIDFYDEDLPWRYSPKAYAGDHRLHPWLALIVLKESEFKDGKNIKDKPLPFIKLDAGAQLHKADQSWAWAHVHVNRDILGGEVRKEETTSRDIGKALKNVLNEDPDLAYSRIVCPRKLEEKEAYHAFLVPVFESGRLAGLGNDPNTVSSPSDFAWDAAAIPADHQVPYYHRWYFRTGTVGDFEYLVRLLQPKPVDSRVGKRDMDVQRPGANLKGIIDQPDTPEAERLEGILKLGGALKVPDAFYTNEEFEVVQNYEYWAFRKDLTDSEIQNSTSENQPLNITDLRDFQTSLGAFINLSDGYEEAEAGTVNSDPDIEQEIDASQPTEYDINNNPDPLITVPLYGRWHSLTQRLLKERDGTAKSPNYNWVGELNLDPRWRVSAGFGTKVVQQNQENYMKAAWAQVGEIVEANRRVRQAQLSKAVTEIWHTAHLASIKERKVGKWLSLTAPLHSRVITQGFTVHHLKKESRVTLAATSVNMRKLLRPRGKLVKRLNFTEEHTPDQLIGRINQGEVSAAPPRGVPDGIQTLEDIADIARPFGLPDFIQDLLERLPWIKWIALIVALILLILLLIFMPAATGMGIGIAVVAGLLYLYRLLNIWTQQIENSNTILEEIPSPESVDELPGSPDFRISEPGDGFVPSRGGADNEEAKKFKAALKDVHTLIAEGKRLGERAPRPALDIDLVATDVFQGIDPVITIPRWTFAGFVIPPFIQLHFQEEFVEAMAYPKIEVPMYKPLVDSSTELFLPNINLIEQNSISLLETNQKFIESYMVGLNHEFARELLWREYPTDQRGSYFRQFWDVSGYMDSTQLNFEDIKQRYKTILDQRKVSELQEYYNQILDPEGPRDNDFLRKAKQVVLKEELKDIIPLHYWSKFSKLGGHDNREKPGEGGEEVVLVIRGELLKKYPTAVIYAHKAVWQDEDGEPVLSSGQTINLKAERMLMPIPESQQEDPPPTIIKSPLYEAKVDPDIYFFGFDLTVCEAQGGTGDANKPVSARCAAEGIERLDAGWFFVIKERPGEPRFGLDIGEESGIEEENGDLKIELWNDLTWGDLTPEVEDGGYIEITSTTETITADQELETEDKEKENQQPEDKKVEWSKDMSSAELAYILYQVPVLVGIHATEMLLKK